MSATNVVIPADKPYAVFELPVYHGSESTDYAAPVCTAWLENVSIKMCTKTSKETIFAAICKWPPDESKLSEYLEKKKKPTNTWIIYKNVNILKFCKSVRQAKEEVEKALNVPDLSQSDDTNEKRKRFVPRRYSPSLDTTAWNPCKRNIVYTDNSDSDFELKAPPIRNLKIRNNNWKEGKALNNNTDTDDSNVGDNYIQQKQSGYNERTIMAAIRDLRDRVDKLHVTVTKIYTVTCNPVEASENVAGIPTIPLTSMEEFCKWEDFIMDEENKLIIVRLLVKHGKGGLKGSIYCIMRKLMTNKVAVNFYLKGTNREGAPIEKKKFLDTITYGLVIAALKMHKKERANNGIDIFYNREVANFHIANWLKDAKKRFENEELRKRETRKNGKTSEIGM